MWGLTLRQARVWNLWPMKSVSRSGSPTRCGFDPSHPSVEEKAHLEETLNQTSLLAHPAPAGNVRCHCHRDRKAGTLLYLPVVFALGLLGDVEIIDIIKAMTEWFLRASGGRGQPFGAAEECVQWLKEAANKHSSLGLGRGQPLLSWQGDID
ncbi:hypothetical protein CRG98_037414 [Punica granatum]|uniref:Uncharacterized protein n=1 Tax=Punica granatum TaxID=22663 RepID=A0A2I0IDV1_PUNGR|nr:hypothetical protein CRG98_037414 [Punica granatum]